MYPTYMTATKADLKADMAASGGVLAAEYASAAALAPLAGSSVRYGRPTFDFAAAPSLFVAEDLRQEDFSLAHRNNINSVLAQAEVFEAEAVSVRRNKESDAARALAEERAAARYAAETREIERASVAQRASLESKFRDAEMAAQAAAAQAEEYRQMLASASAEQQRAGAEHAKAAQVSEEAARCARECEFGATQARLANDNCFAERHVLEGQGHRNPLISSAIATRGPYTSDGGFGGTAVAPSGYGPFASAQALTNCGRPLAAVQGRQRSSRFY
jgi:hypothetical protein